MKTEKRQQNKTEAAPSEKRYGSEVSERRHNRRKYGCL